MIVIPMAGLSSRFTKAGYDRPKWMLPLAGRPLLDWSLLSFASYFDSEEFLIVFLDKPGVGRFIEERATEIGISNALLIPLGEPTAGQAETVSLGLQRQGVSDDTDVTIFNIDTIRPGYVRSPALASSQGWLECFKGEGEHWSFVKEDQNSPGVASSVTEKVRISDNCCTGMYWFASASGYEAAYRREVDDPKAAELFVAPLYQRMIDEEKVVSFGVIRPDEIFFSGTPAEYEHAKTQETDLLTSFKQVI